MSIKICLRPRLFLTRIKPTSTYAVEEFQQTLAKVCGAIAEAGVNITAICVCVVGEEGYFRLLTSDNAKATTALKPLGFKISESEVVTVELENKVGAVKKLAQKLAKAEIDLKSFYGTTCGDGPATLILTADNNQKAKDLLR